MNATCAPSDGGLHNFFEADQSFVYLRCAVADSDGADIAQFFERTNAFIADGIASGYSVLVHCQQGVSRSASLILAYLIRTQAMTLKGAYMHLKQRRPLVKPNSNFLRQLIEWEKRGVVAAAATAPASSGAAIAGAGGDAANAKKRARQSPEVVEGSEADADAPAPATVATPSSNSLLSPSSASASASAAAQSSESTDEGASADAPSAAVDASVANAPEAKRSKTAAATSDASDSLPMPPLVSPSMPPAPRVAGPMRPPPAAE